MQFLQKQLFFRVIKCLISKINITSIFNLNQSDIIFIFIFLNFYQIILTTRSLIIHSSVILSKQNKIIVYYTYIKIVTVVQVGNSKMDLIHAVHSEKNVQKVTQLRQTQKNSKRLKNPYNINISFNINNPRKVISNNINKTIKIQNYSFGESKNDSMRKSFHQNSLNLYEKKYQQLKREQFQSGNAFSPKRKMKKSKGKPKYDISRKSKSDFTYDTSILNFPFSGEDPMPQGAVKKLNKMKKYFLQRIGSMDITVPQEQIQKDQPSLQKLTSNLNIPKQQYNPSHPSIKQDEQDIMTQKFTQYQYQNLISYQNQNGHKNTESIMRSKQLFDYEMTRGFPQTIQDSYNSASIRNQYTHHHNKFLSQNVKMFYEKNATQKVLRKAQKKKRVSENLRKIIIYNYSTSPSNLFMKDPYKIDNYKPKKVSKLALDRNQIQSKKLKQKIKIIKNLLLKSNSSQSILQNLSTQELQSLQNQRQSNKNNQKQSKRTMRKQYVIKTQIQLPNDLMKQIKMFQNQIQNQNKGNQIKGANYQVRQKLDKPQCKLDQNEENYIQFLRGRVDNGNEKITNQIIQNYIDLLGQQTHHQGYVVQEAQSIILAEKSQIINNKNQQKLEQQIPNRAFQVEQLNQYDNISSDVSSYIYGYDQQNINQSSDFDGYSHQRNQKINLQRRMRQELNEKLHFTASAQGKNVLKIITNSDNLQHQIKQNNSELQFKRTQHWFGIQKQKQSKNKEEIQNNQFDLTQEVDTIIQFLKKNINNNNNNKNDKDLLEELYNKLTLVSKNQTYQADIGRTLNDDAQRRQGKEQFVSTPIKKQLIKSGKQVKISKTHRRAFSIQKDSQNNKNVMQNSDDLDLWDLKIVQQRLSKKYNQITYQKQKKLFQIQSDQLLTNRQYQDRIDELGVWQSQAKKQILNTKKQIKNNVQKLRKILSPQKDNMNFSINSFSQKHLPFVFCQFKKKQLNRHGRQKPQQKDNKQETKSNHSNKESKQQKGVDKQKQRLKKQIKQSMIQKYQNLIHSLQIGLDEVFVQNETPKRQIDISNQPVQSVPHPIYNQSACFIKLFDTENRLNEENDMSVGSSGLSDQQCQNQKVNSDDEMQKKYFNDLISNQKYKLSSSNQFQDHDVGQHTESIQTQNYLQNKSFSKSTQAKSVGISQDDRIDICEFIFLDLCIQLYQQTLDLQDTQIKQGHHKNTSSHRIIDKIFGYISKQKKKPKKKGPKIGIHTQLTTVKEYIQKIRKDVQLLKQIKQTSLQDQKGQILIINRINVPIGPTAAQILKTMRFNEDDLFKFDQEEQNAEQFQNDGLNSLILPIHVFTDFEGKIQFDKQFEFDQYFQDQQKENNRIAFLKNVTHVHHKAIFDSLNQMLDYQRPFGIWGKPFPWRNKSDKERAIGQPSLKNSLKSACNKVTQCAMYMCGLLTDKQQSLLKNSLVSQAYIEEVKQDRMSKMIVNDFLQNQNRFYFLDDEQTEILLETSYIVWVLLVQEAIRQFKVVMNRDLH